MNLPEEFTRRMKLLLEPEDFKAFIESYSDDKSYGLRINPLKIESQETLPFFLSPVPWAKEGFYAVPEEKPGRHALHEAGAYYIQEPSAMAVAALLAEPKALNVRQTFLNNDNKTHQMIMQLFLQKAPLQKFVTSVPHRAVNRHRLPVCWAIKGFSSQTRFSHSVLKSFRRISKDSVYQMLLYAMRHLKTWQNSFHAFLIRLWWMLHAQVKECLEKTKRQ